MPGERCFVAGTLRASLDVSLLTPHAEFLSRLSGAQDPAPRVPFGPAGSVTLSQTLSLLIEHYEQTVPMEKPRPIKRVRKHFSVPDRYIEFVNDVSVRWGVGRSEAVRRIIDHAIKSGFKTSAVTPRAA